MIKKILLIVVILLISALLVLISPLSSLMLKSALESKIEDQFDAEIDFTGFDFQLLKGLKIDKVSFRKNNFNIESDKTVLKFKSVSILKKDFIINCTIEKVRLRHKKQNFIPIISLISGKSNLSLLKDLDFDYIKMQIVYDAGNISFNNIEAIGKQAKLFGNIAYQKEVTDYDLDLYLPSDTTESLPDLAKVLLRVDNEGNWSKFDINLSIQNQRNR